MYNLPPEILEKILYNVNYNDVIKVNKHWKNFAENSKFIFKRLTLNLLQINFNKIKNFNPKHITINLIDDFKDLKKLKFINKNFLLILNTFKNLKSIKINLKLNQNENDNDKILNSTLKNINWNKKIVDSIKFLKYIMNKLLIKNLTENIFFSIYVKDNIINDDYCCYEFLILHHLISKYCIYFKKFIFCGTDTLFFLYDYKLSLLIYRKSDHKLTNNKFEKNLNIKFNFFSRVFAICKNIIIYSDSLIILKEYTKNLFLNKFKQKKLIFYYFIENSDNEIKNAFTFDNSIDLIQSGFYKQYKNIDKLIYPFNLIIVVNNKKLYNSKYILIKYNNEIK